MAVALARSRAEATPSRTQAPAAVPVVQRTSRDSRRYGLSGRSIQPALRISAAHDPAEREAESVAARVARGGIGHAAPGLQRSPLLVQRQSPGAAGGVASPVVEARVRAAATGGSPLVPALRQTLEPRFRADFGGVRLHTDAKAAALATAIGARAFTFGNHIFFNAGQYQPQTPEGLELLAHELTHTIQQQAVIQRAVNDAPVIGERTAPQASRLGMSDALNYFADAANAIPGYRMFTILIGVNPINMNAVEASAANILRALVEFLPGGVVITRVLDSYGIFDRVGGWIEGQLKSLGITGAAIRAAVNAFMDGLSWRDIFALGSLWDRAQSIFTTPITRIIAFAKSLFGEILRFVREAVLRPLAALAEGTAGYGLLKAVIGFDPVTGEAVPRTAETIIGGFMTMIGQQELWENIKKANAIPRAWAWFQGALGGLMGLVRSIPERFMAALRGLEIMDFVVLPSAFVKLAKVFGGFLVDFGSWALGTVLNLLQIIVEVLAPGVMPYLRKAAGAFNTIIANPVRFVQTLVRAAVQGFKQFASRFLTHLQASLIGWLTGALGGAGLYLPKSLAPMELVKFVLSVLGLTWANIRGKLVAATSETVVTALETGFDIVRTLVTEGPAAAWQKIVETLTNLKQMAIDAIMDFVKSKVVEAAITKLLSLLSPAGALIQAIIATYNTIMFFVERIRQIAQVAAAFIDGIAAIAAGNIAPAADRVEQTMAGLLTLVISFLARIAGLGKVGDAVTGLIAKIRAPIDKALDKVVAWIVATAGKAANLVRGGAQRAVNAARNILGAIGRQQAVTGGRESHSFWVDTAGPTPRLLMRSAQKPMSQHLGDFAQRAQALVNTESKTRTLNLINTQAAPKVQLIENKAAQIAANPLNTQVRTRLDSEITGLEGQLAAPMTSILEAINIRIPRETSILSIKFNIGPGFTSADHPEFTRQLSMQAQGINQMTVSAWRRNRATFSARKTASGGSGSGRDPRSRTLQAQERTRVRGALQDMLTQPQGAASGRGLTFYELAFVTQTFAAQTPAVRATGLVPGTAAVLIGTWMTRQAALHSPDQVGGGLAADLTGLGSTNVNSSIGSSWGNGKAAELESKLVRDLDTGCGQGGGRVQESLEGIMQMRVSLGI